jgi:hypothetical protein
MSDTKKSSERTEPHVSHTTEPSWQIEVAVWEQIETFSFMQVHLNGFDDLE